MILSLTQLTIIRLYNRCFFCIIFSSLFTKLLNIAVILSAVCVDYPPLPLGMKSWGGNSVHQRHTQSQYSIVFEFTQISTVKGFKVLKKTNEAHAALIPWAVTQIVLLILFHKTLCSIKYTPSQIILTDVTNISPLCFRRLPSTMISWLRVLCKNVEAHSYNLEMLIYETLLLI